ncbi:DHA2 family multidrug resistance protein-like MFS transporter [Murinocardiopsis flavida]|uniref:DHA2 family multidrug resistance protein-like MFS transporter n=1 Tax=Murinocardiopsis flavida TaxID=645275 RepID=A0A2P8DDT8_9ACTN|nr:MFS transporter [Murinocardiopsis flavida]PSK95359.1 DHA2 family multidrug resistance protein-like MFS transporter [Murinocardiopsis flavida]
MTERSPHRLNPHLYGILALFGTVMLIGGTDMTKVAVALPALSGDLNVDSVQSLWVADIYPLAAGVVLVPSAVAADRFGRKRGYLLGVLIAAISAAAAALAPTAEVLIAARVGQGVGAALLIAGTVAIIRVTFPGLRLRAVAYGVWTAGFSAGSALGPLLGGGIVELAHWRWVFWINVPVLLICFIGALVVLRESRNPDPPSLDALSAVLSAIAVGALVAGLKGPSRADIAPWLSLAAIAIAAVAAVLFVVRQLRLPRPFLDVGLFTNGLLASAAAVIAVTNGAFNGTLYLLMQRYQVVDGLSAVQAGIALLPLAAASAVGGLLGPALQRRSTQQHIIAGGLALTAAGFVLVATARGGGELAGMTLLGLGAGIIMAIGANAVMSTAPENRAADAGAVQESAFALGAGTGVAALGVLAIHSGARGAPGASASAVYGPGAETALVIGALAYASFAVAASVVILGTRTGTPPVRATQSTGER